MVKVAIPINENFMCADFGACTTFVIYDIDQKIIKSRHVEAPIASNNIILLKWIEDMGITDLIVHRIDQTILQKFSDTKLNLFIGVSLNSPENLIDDYLHGCIQSDAQSIREKQF
ncbi:MAG: hypothetical protein HOD63_09895 [Bacteroidetes bacterium]|jgi:predicted Fe-Mo cluster-binding NifX family protein|nr:hypothetical protein [Bacteroidota bacterium]MBT5529646.1 hypothetical protein [Cytophagia bacterium]MBT3421618.1 hypothetical protein [Bacteroidota bacterium]MBT3801226.1 hypothetical protein [Bacteroidota bacterium]MBT4338892.1 hypothetical protein [Bacteroidota bacterium]